jgi:hypothetical protein
VTACTAQTAGESGHAHAIKKIPILADAHLRGFNHAGLAPACALTIGNFDGVHRGHQAMLALLKNEAQHRGVPSCVMTFEPHPRDYFAAVRTSPNWRRRASPPCATS